MRIEVNTLGYTTGGVLSMKYEDEQWRPIVYFSKSLNKIEKSYEIHDKKRC